MQGAIGLWSSKDATDYRKFLVRCIYAGRDIRGTRQQRVDLGEHLRGLARDVLVAVRGHLAVPVQQVLARHPHVVEHDPAVVHAVEAHLAAAVGQGDAGQGVPRLVADGHEHRVHAVALGLAAGRRAVELHEHRRHAPVARGVADVVLARRLGRRVDDELLGGRVVGRRRVDRLDVGAVTGLGHREAAQQLALDDRALRELPIVVAAPTREVEVLVLQRVLHLVRDDHALHGQALGALERDHQLAGLGVVEGRDLLLDDVVWTGGSDFRRLFTDDEVYLNGRLAPLYGATMAANAPFQRVRLDGGMRGGVLSHPYMMSVLSYSGATSPIHRGVFLARSVLGNVLKPPQEAVAPLAPDQHPDLTTRERVALQTSAVACQTCHTMIDPLGFALEEFDAIGRYRAAEKRAGGSEAKPIDAAGSYLPREGPEATFNGARELAAYVATSRDAQEAFVRSLFHALVKQPVRAWGPETLEHLRGEFEKSGFDIRRLLVDIMTVAAAPPKLEVARQETTK